MTTNINFHNAKLKYFIIDSKQICISKSFLITTKGEIYEVKPEIVSLTKEEVKYDVRLSKVNLANIDYPLSILGVETIPQMIERMFLPFKSYDQLQNILDINFFSASLKKEELRHRLYKIEALLPKYPPLCVAYFRMLDGLLSLLYARNILEMRTNITFFYILDQNNKYKSPHNSMLEYCLLELNRIEG